MADFGVEVGVRLDLFGQIDNTVITKTWNLMPILRVQRNELITGRYRDDALFAAVGPISHTAIAPANAVDPRALINSPHPQRLAGACIGGNNRAAVSGWEIQNSVHHQGRDFRLVFGARAEIVGSPDPRDLEILDVVPINRFQGGIPRAAGIAAIDTPFPALRPLLTGDGHRQQKHESDKHQNFWLNQLSCHLLSPYLLRAKPLATICDAILEVKKADVGVQCAASYLSPATDILYPGKEGA